jgi:hypothetical protein
MASSTPTTSSSSMKNKIATEKKKKENKSMSKEQVRKIVDWAIAQNPLVYRRLADI